MTSRLPAARCQGGFTLMEMAVVLVIIALILGGVSVGRDVYRSAQAERLGSEFVQGWLLAYERYVQQTARVPGDDTGATGRINGRVDDPLCDQALQDVMLRAGITLPPGRAEGLANRALYQDANGAPQEVRLCLLHLADWSEPAPGLSRKARPRNVLRLEGLTPELARQLDVRIDGKVDARHGLMREKGPHARTDTVRVGDDHPWSRHGDETARRNNDTAAVPLLTAYIALSR